MVASLNWPSEMPQRLQAQSARIQPGPQLVDRYEAATPIYFVRTRTKTRRVTGNLRITFPQRDLWIQIEPSYRGRRFNADFENFGSTRETIIDDWSLAPTTGGTAFTLSLVLTVFDAGQKFTTLEPSEAAVLFVGNSPTRTP